MSALLFYILTLKSGRVSACVSAQSWRLYSAVPLEDQVISTISHTILFNHCPTFLTPSTRLGSNNYQFSGMKDLRDIVDFRNYYCTASAYSVVYLVQMSHAAPSAYHNVWNLTSKNVPRSPDSTKPVREYPRYHGNWPERFLCWRFNAWQHLRFNGLIISAWFRRFGPGTTFIPEF